MKYLENSIIRCTFAKVIKICVEMELNKELGKWLLDISKYLITAMLLTTAFGDMSNPWIVVSVIFSAALTFWLGYLLLKKSTQSINNGVKYKNDRYRKFNKNKKI